MYSLRAYNEHTHTNVWVSSFCETAVAMVWVAPWPKSCRRRPPSYFMVYPGGDESKRFLTLERNEILCIYHKETLLAWTTYDHVVYPCFVVTRTESKYSPPSAKRLEGSRDEEEEEDDERLWVVRGESKELCKEALLTARRFTITSSAK